MGEIPVKCLADILLGFDRVRKGHVPQPHIPIDRDDVITLTNVGGLSRYTRYDSNAGGDLSDGVPMWRDNNWGQRRSSCPATSTATATPTELCPLIPRAHGIACAPTAPTAPTAAHCRPLPPTAKRTPHRAALTPQHGARSPAAHTGVA